MTAGRGIAHAERTPVVNRGRLDGVQLWVALPGQDRHVAASLQHVSDLPAAELRGGIVRLFSGSLGGVTSAARHYSELVGAEVEVHRGEAFVFGVNPNHEHGILVLRGDCALDGRALEERRLYYLGTKRSGVSLTSRVGARLLLLGGPPFPEKILMWWNFVARTPEEIAEARADWEAHTRFGEVVAYEGPRLEAPGYVQHAE
jgi:quercetin 2,3-dioxygenase